MRFGAWSVTSLYRAGSLLTVVKDVSKKLDLVEVQVTWDKGCTETAGELCIFQWKGEEQS
jgi:hypothetical protein